MRFSTVLFSVILIALVAGCADYLVNLSGTGPLLIPATQPGVPLTYKERVDQLQKNLDTVWQGIRFVHSAGGISDSQFEVLKTDYDTAQSAVNVAYTADVEKPLDAEEILRRAADAIEAYKGRGTPGK